MSFDAVVVSEAVVVSGAVVVADAVVVSDVVVSDAVVASDELHCGSAARKIWSQILYYCRLVSSYIYLADGTCKKITLSVNRKKSNGHWDS